MCGRSCSSKGSATRLRWRRSPSAEVGIFAWRAFRSCRSEAHRRSEPSLEQFGPNGLGVRLAGLCDEGEERDFQRGLERAGLGSDLTRAGMEALGFYVCVADLEDELIRALGAAAVEEVVEAQGELGPFRTLQKQPAWRGRPQDEQLRRFMGSGGRRKIRYARLLVEALDLTEVPRPLDLVLAGVTF